MGWKDEMRWKKDPLTIKFSVAKVLLVSEGKKGNRDCS
jgi:hypothetical protein